MTVTANATTASGTRPRTAATRTARLADIRAAGLVRHASEPAAGGVERSLPVAPEIRPLLPAGQLRRGGTVSVLGRPGATSLLLALLARASAAGSWSAAVGMPRLGLVAAAEAGVSVDRFALVPFPGPDWTSVVAALLDGVDIVATAPPGPVSPRVADRLVARARQRGAVLISLGPWPAAEVTLEVVGARWQGLEAGRGRLRRRELAVLARGRGVSARARQVDLLLPGPAGAVAGSPSDEAAAEPRRLVAA